MSLNTQLTMKRGDTKPDLRIACTINGQDPVNLAAANQVRLIGVRPGQGRVIDTVLTGGVDGIVTYNWQPEDTEQVGRILVEVEVTWSDGTTQTFPGTGYLTVIVEEDLG
jgi:hypothetical protein